MKKIITSIGAIAGFTAAILILAAPQTLRAQDDRWSVSASNWMQYWYNQPEPNWIRSSPIDTLPPDTLRSVRDSLDNRFSVDFNFGNFYAGAWLRSYQPNFTAAANEKITQRYMGWKQDGITIHAGNFYQTFDRGMTLNAFLDDAVNFDNNLDGIKISGLYDHFDFDAISGRGFRFQQGMNEFTIQRDFTVRGIRGAVKPFNGFKYGGSFVIFKQSSSIQSQQSDNIELFSVNHEINKGPFNVYAEYAHKEGHTAEEEATDGDGTYLSASYSHKYFSIYSEYKNVFRLLYPGTTGPFNAPPPVSHSGRNLTSLANVPGERGYQIGGLISPSFDLNFDLAFSEAYSRGVINRAYLSEKYAGVRWNPIEKFVFNSHWDRFDYTEEDEIETYFDGYYYINPTQTVSFSAYSKRFWPVGNDYHEDYLTIGYSRGNIVEVTVGGSLSNKTYSPGEKADPKKLASIELTFHYKTHELSVFHGGERGGLICSSGVCSLRPTFQGTRIILLSRF
jgi:hypothetical protein